MPGRSSHKPYRSECAPSLRWACRSGIYDTFVRHDDFVDFKTMYRKKSINAKYQALRPFTCTCTCPPRALTSFYSERLAC
jgi:hypothetical protein